MILAHKTRIRTANPGSAIANALAQHDGAARWAYNNLLASLKDGIESSSGGLWPSVGALAKTLRREKPAWWASVDWEMLDNGRLRLDTALKRWRQCRTGKHDWHQLGNLRVPPIPQTWRPEGDHVQHEVRIKQENGRWYASVNYWKPPVATEEKTHLCGAVDVGITPLAVDSELVHYENPKALYQSLRKLRRWQRTLARRTVGSRGWQEAQQRVAAIHRRINELRENAHHQVSRMLVRKYAVLAVETLNVAGMDKLRHQAKAVRDAAIGGLLQKIRYKADWYGTIVVEADRFFPSSKLCSDCGAHNAELGRELYWTCPQCGVRHDRNENAALNLLTLAINPARELGKLALGPVGPDVTLLDGKALANGSNAGGETGPGEGRTALSTPASPAVDGGAAPYGGSRSEVVINIQLQLAI